MSKLERMKSEYGLLKIWSNERGDVILALISNPEKDMELLFALDEFFRTEDNEDSLIITVKDSEEQLEITPSFVEVDLND